MKASLAGLWRFSPQHSCCSDLAYESLLVSRSRLAFELKTPEPLYLGACRSVSLCLHAFVSTAI